MQIFINENMEIVAIFNDATSKLVNFIQPAMFSENYVSPPRQVCGLST